MYTFRDFEKSLCILRDPSIVALISKENIDGTNAILCYGYIDHIAGLTFEILSLVSYTDENYTIVFDCDKISLKIRVDADKMRNAIPILNKNLLLRYSERISLLDLYYQKLEVVEARRVISLDPLRHPQYPDDISVVFIWDDNDYEQMWVRCEKYLFTCDKGAQLFSGQLLNEPNRDHGLHIGEHVNFALITDNDQTICIRSEDFPN